MKNKLLAMLLALCMVMALLPAMAFADDTTGSTGVCTCSWPVKETVTTPVLDEDGKEQIDDDGNVITESKVVESRKSCSGCTGRDDCDTNDTMYGCDPDCEVCSYYCECGCEAMCKNGCSCIPWQPCGRGCTCGRETYGDIPEGHCLCKELDCTARGHVGGDDGTACVIVPENGTLCDDCLAYVASKNGDKKDDGQKPAQPTTPAVDPDAPKKAEDFSDVDAGMWYNDDLTTMLEKGWFVGQAGGKFAPQNATTGAEVVVILSRVAGEDLVTTGSGWNVAATEWAAQQGITDGIEITTSGTLARQDLILMLWRAAGKPASSHALDFTDIDGVSGDALTALRWAVEKGIVKGNGDGTVSPNGATKRCEMAALMVRYDKAVKG